VATERMARRSFGQQDHELFPDGLDDVYGGNAGTEYAPSHRVASRTPRMIEQSVPVYTKMSSLWAQALNEVIHKVKHLKRDSCVP